MKAQVKKNLTTDPQNKQGQTGYVYSITYMDADVFYKIKFDDDKFGVYVESAIDILLEPEVPKILPNTFSTWQKKHFND